MLERSLWAFGRCAILISGCMVMASASLIAQENAGSSGTVEQLTAMLQAIDPYRPTAEASGTIKVFGSTSMDALAHGWTSGFQQFHPQAKIEISAAGSEKAFEQIVAEPTSLIMLSRPVKNEELEALQKRGLKNPVAFTVAREALSVFVHASNPVERISGEQLRDVFTTEIHPDQLTWGSLGATGNWNSKPIHVMSRSESSGTQKFLSDFMFQGASLRSGVSDHVSNAQVLQALEQDPLAIAICGYRSRIKSAKPLQLTAGATLIPSDDHAVLSGQYPLMRPLSLIVDMGQTDAAAKSAQELVRYALCQAGQTQAILVGFFPVDLPLLRAGLEKLDPSAELR